MDKSDAVAFGTVKRDPNVLDNVARPGGNIHKVAPVSGEGKNIGESRPGNTIGTPTPRSSGESGGWARPGKAGSGQGA